MLVGYALRLCLRLCTAWKLVGLEAMLVAMHVLAWRLGDASGVLAMLVANARLGF